VLFDFDAGVLRLGPLKPKDVEIEVHSCGICHSDLSVLHSE